MICRHCRREVEEHESGLCDSCETQDSYDRGVDEETSTQLRELRVGTLIEVIPDAYRPEPAGLGLTGRIFTEPVVSQATGEVVFGARLELDPSGSLNKIVRARNARVVPPRPGDRMQLKHDVDRYPHFIAEKGAQGTVVDVGERVIALRLDETLAGAEDWDNEIHWYPENGDDVYRDAGVID